MLKYEFFLQNNKIRTYRLFSWLIILLNLAALLYLALYGNDLARPVSMITIGFILFIIAYWYYRKKDEKQYDAPFNYIFLGIFLNWLIMQYYWLAVLMLVLLILQGLALKKSRVYVSSEKITYPAFTTKLILWDELNNVMIRDGLLTIDFKSNKLIQQLIDNRFSSINEKEFNDFCRQQLKK